MSTRATGLFGGFDGGRPPQGQYLYQRNAMGTINTINKLDSVTTFKVNADYSYQRATHDISQSSTYLTGDGSYVTVTEQTSPLTKIHLPRLSMNYRKNADRSYLDETFVVKGKFEQNEGDVLANQQQIEAEKEGLVVRGGRQCLLVIPFAQGRLSLSERRHIVQAHPYAAPVVL